MKRILIPILVYVLLPVEISCQNWFPDGAEWYFNDQWWMSYKAEGYFKYSVDGDTLFHQKKAKRIIKQWYSFMDGSLWEQDTLFLLEENSQISYWTGTQFRIMYDFTLIPGDTLEMEVKRGAECDSVTPITVDSIGSINIMGTSLKVQYFSYTEYYYLNDPWMENYKIQDIIIERIGRSNEFIFSQPACGIDVLFTENKSLRCYTDKDISYRTEWFTQRYNNAPCDTFIYGWFDNIQNSDEDLVKIYPNPCQDKIWIEQSPSPVSNIKILNSSGVLIFNEDNDTKSRIEINTSNYSNGLYFIFITTGNTYHTSKLIKL